MSRSNNQEGFGLIKERLDRAISDQKWLTENDSVKVRHLSSEESDHCSL